MKNLKYLKRKSRHFKMRKRIFGTESKPRLSIFRSNKNLYVQIINDETHNTIVSYSTKKLGKVSNNIETAKIVGEKIAELAILKKITSIVFDRGGFLFHGKIKAVADSLRKKGLKF